MSTRKPHLLLAFALGLGMTAETVTLLGAGSQDSVDVRARAAGIVTVCQTAPIGCDHATVQAAVDAAAEGDLIKVAAGVYTGVEARPAPSEYVDLGGSAVITQMVYVDKSISIRGGYTTTNGFADPPDPTADPTTLDAGEQGRVFFIWGDITAGVENLRIVGGDALVHSGEAWRVAKGGGLYARGATITIKNGWVYGNTGHHGGGAFLDSCDLALAGNTVSTNTAASHGGGLMIAGTGGRLAGNQIYSNDASYGGGLSLAHTDLVFLGNDVTSNHATGRGGGFYFEYGDHVEMAGNNVSGNWTTFYGGGGLILIMGTGQFNYNTFRANSASEGGGLMVYNSGASLVGNTIVSNHGESGVYVYGGDGLTMTNDLIAGNEGAGLHVEEASGRAAHATFARNDQYGVLVGDVDYPDEPGAMVLTNTILVSQAWGVYVHSANTAMLEATLWGTATWANDTDWAGSGAIVTGTINIWDDPGFIAPEVGDYHLGPESGATDVGVDAGIRSDLDHEPRPYQGPDLGADEYWPPGVLRFIHLPMVMRNH